MRYPKILAAERVIAACVMACLTLTLFLSSSAWAAEEKPKPQVLFTNASVFDGFAEDLIEGANVLVEGNVITQVSTKAIDAPNATVIDATGKYLTPGLIDMHTHSGHCQSKLA